MLQLYYSLLAHRSSRRRKGSTVPLNLPATDHNLPSDLTLPISTPMEGDAPSKTIAFLCFHSSQSTSRKIVWRSFQLLLSIPFFSRSHRARESCAVSVHSSWPEASHTTAHTDLANTHVSRTWLMVSSSWSQKGHESRCGNPFLARRSKVQHVFLSASQGKNLHVDGALDFQVSWAIGSTVRPQNFAAYADRTE